MHTFVIKNNTPENSIIRTLDTRMVKRAAFQLSTTTGGSAIILVDASIDKKTWTNIATMSVNDADGLTDGGNAEFIWNYTRFSVGAISDQDATLTFTARS